MADVLPSLGDEDRPLGPVHAESIGEGAMVDTADTPFALLPGEGEARWFQQPHADQEHWATTGGRLTVVELRGPAWSGVTARGTWLPLTLTRVEPDFLMRNLLAS